MGQVFRWNGRVWDIGRLLSDIATGALRPRLIKLDRSFAEVYGQEVLVRAQGRIAIDVRHTLVTSPDKFHEPIVLLHVGQGEGIVAPYEGSPEDNSWVVGDGNHRTLAAGLHGQDLRAYVLTDDESQLYEIGEDDPHA
jgi:hypothetical protein